MRFPRRSVRGFMMLRVNDGEITNRAGCREHLKVQGFQIWERNSLMGVTQEQQLLAGTCIVWRSPLYQGSNGIPISRVSFT